MSQFYFEFEDASNFLSPEVFLVGVHDGGTDNHMNEFINNSTWKIFWDKEEDNERVQQFHKWNDRIGKGDILVAKRLNGRGSVTMTVLAVGIVIGKMAGGKLNVAWVLPNINKAVPLKCVGTISSPYTLDELKKAGKDWEDILKWAKKARKIFLERNLSIEKRIYL